MRSKKPRLADFPLDWLQMPDSQSEPWLDRWRQGWKTRKAELERKRKSKKGTNR